jgi:hypothetical protein
MSVLYPCLGRILSQAPQLNSNLRFLSLTQKQFKRNANEKLKKPDDKTDVVIGKVPKIIERRTEGVSDVQYPILMKWNKPQRIETCNPAISGDMAGLEHFPKVDLSQPAVHLEGSKEMESASDEVKRILSLEFARRKDVMKKLKKNLVSDVQSHKLDMNSLEVKIAIQTVRIRNFQHLLIQAWPYKNQPMKHSLTRAIASRRLNLERLRQKDYKKYEWILEKLNLFYKPVPKYDHMEISRKASIEKLTDIWCDELKKHRLTRHRTELEAKQPQFLRDKAAKLEHIMSEEAELGLEPSVTQSQVDECLRRAAEIEASIAEKQGRREEEQMLLYTEEAAQQSAAS